METKTTTQEKNEKIISAVNELIEINNDRVLGYERAISETDDEDLIHLFTNMAAHSRESRAELAKEVTALGGEPTEGTKNTGKIFRIWMDVKAALTGKDKKEILNSCEFGETAALDTYKSVLENEDVVLPQNIISMVKAQQKEIQLDHSRIKALIEYGNHL